MYKHGPGMRRHIRLASAKPENSPGESFYRRETRGGADGFFLETIRWCEGDNVRIKVITKNALAPGPCGQKATVDKVEEYTIPRVISYQWLLAQVRREPSIDTVAMDTLEPLCEGFVALDGFSSGFHDIPNEHRRHVRGFSVIDGRPIIVCHGISNNSIPKTHGYEYMREKGASKQAAYESVAAERRRSLDFYMKVLKDQILAYDLMVDITLGPDTYERYLATTFDESDPDYEEHYQMTIQEMASDVAFDIRANGYIVEGDPEHDEELQRVTKRRNRLDYLRGKLNMFNFIEGDF